MTRLADLISRFLRYFPFGYLHCPSVHSQFPIRLFTLSICLLSNMLNRRATVDHSHYAEVYKNVKSDLLISTVISENYRGSTLRN